MIVLSKPSLKVDLTKKEEITPVSVTTKNWSSSTNNIYLGKAPQVSKENYWKHGETGINANDYFGIDLSDFLVDKQLDDNLDMWMKGSNDAKYYLSRFKNIEDQKQVALLFTNQVKYIGHMPEMQMDELYNTIQTTFLIPDISTPQKDKFDVTLYISGLANRLVKNGNKICAMKNCRYFEIKNNKRIEIASTLHNLNELKDCKNKKIYIYVPFIATYSKRNFYDSSLSFLGDIR